MSDRNSLPVALGISLVALLVSAVAMITVLRKSNTPSPGVDTATRTVTPEGSEPELLERLEAALDRLDDLSDENRELRERLAELEEPEATRAGTRTTEDPDAGTVVSRAELEDLRDQVRALRDSSDVFLAGADIAGEPGALKRRLKEQVEATIDEIRQREEVAHLRAENEEFLEHLDEILPEIQEWLELTSVQTEEMRSALVAKLERDAERLRLWEEGATEPEVDAMWQSSTRTFYDDLDRFLTPEQLEEAWHELGEGEEPPVD